MVPLIKFILFLKKNHFFTRCSFQKKKIEKKTETVTKKKMYSWNLCVHIRADICFRNIIYLPPSILELCVEKNKATPFFFSLRSEYYTSYHGVQEFTSNENEIDIPMNLAKQLNLYENQIVSVKLEWNIPFAKKLVLEPLQKQFFNIENMDEQLEKGLSGISVMYPNQTFSMMLDNDIYSFFIKEIAPDWEKVKLENYKDRCYNIIDVNLEVDLFNSYAIKDYYKKKEEEKEEKERIVMNSEDINYAEKKRYSLDEIRKMRLKKFSKH